MKRNDLAFVDDAFVALQNLARVRVITLPAAKKAVVHPRRECGDDTRFGSPPRRR